MSIYTIGFTQKKAETFFSLLAAHQVTRLIDVRLNNVSQLAGFAKRDDLKYFMQAICNADYIHEPLLAPEQKVLKAYKAGDMTWLDYEARFLDLMAKRQVETKFAPQDLEGACLLCSEHKPHHCHRRLVVEYLNTHWQTRLEVKHLL